MSLFFTCSDSHSLAHYANYSNCPTCNFYHPSLISSAKPIDDILIIKVHRKQHFWVQYGGYRGFQYTLHMFKVRFLKMSFFSLLWARNLHFSGTYIHQTFQFYSYLYSEGCNRGVCSDIIHSPIYISTEQTLFFMAVDSICWFMEW